MEDIWLCVDEIDNSSHSSAYSDEIDSEIEAELYGMLHHQESLTDNNNLCKKYSVNDQSPKIANSVNSLTGHISCEGSNNKSKCRTSSLKSLPKISNHFYQKETNLDRSSFQQDVHNFSTPTIQKSGSRQDSGNAILLSTDTEVGNSKQTPKFVSPNNKLAENSPSKNILKQQNAYRFSTPSKRKSDLDQDSCSVILLSTDSDAKNSKQVPEFVSPNKEVNKNSSIKNILKQQNADLDSSDSDESVIFIEKDNIVNNDLKTNLSNNDETVYISSSSDDSDNVSPQLRRKTFLKNVSLPNIEIGENSKDLWYIDDEDRYRFKKRINRYHISKEINCSNCGKGGHIAKSCAVPKPIKCFLCGGAHAGSQCSNRICCKCYRMGHDSRFCLMTFVNYCNHCNMRGHMNKDCPDLWRRYHLTTEPVKIVAGRLLYQDRNIYCSNCGWAGHFGAVCKEPRFFKGSFYTWPCVISYSDPDGMLRKRTDHLRNTKVIDTLNNPKNANFMHAQNNQRNMHLKEEQQLNLDQVLIPKSKIKKLKKWEIFKQRSIARKQANLAVREKNFPRTPKKAKMEKLNDNMPESVELLLKKQLKRRKRNIRRRMNKVNNKGENSKKRKSVNLQQICTK